MESRTLVGVTAVVASCKTNLTWAHYVATRLNVIVYEQCGKDADLPLPFVVRETRRCGREAHSYLEYIVQHWDDLPEHIVFLQGDAPRHIHRFSTRTLLQSIASLVRSKSTFAMLPHSGTVATSPCQVAWKGSSTNPGMQDVQLAIANVSVPVSSHTYAHFYVARERVRRHPVAYYKRLNELFFTGSGPGCGRKTASLFERGWPLMFGCAQPVPAFRVVNSPSYGDFLRACRRPATLFCCAATEETSAPAFLVQGEENRIGCAAWHTAR